MRWPTTSRALLDLVSEQVAISSGLLLTDHEIMGLLEQSPMTDWIPLLRRPADEWFMARPEFLQDLVRVVRAGIGNLPNASPGDVTCGEHLQKLSKSGTNVPAIQDAFLDLLEAWAGKELDEVFAAQVADLSKQPILDVLEVMLAFGEMMDRDTIRSAQAADWNGVTPLSTLFEREAAPLSQQVFLDQKYIDYLVANDNTLDSMHWRNFERLTAEFFQREDHDVVLGPGSKDGGVDVRVWPKGVAQEGPPLLLIQCKRLKRRKLVNLEYVKAFWTDVKFEAAKKGLIATTSRVSPQGKRVATARNYELSFAEHDQILEWVRGMWRFPFSTDKRTVCVGTYFHPPAVPIPKPPWC